MREWPAIWRLAVCAILAAFIQGTLAETELGAKRRNVPVAVD
jgi:hypothetical protein